MEGQNLDSQNLQICSQENLGPNEEGGFDIYVDDQELIPEIELDGKNFENNITSPPQLVSTHNPTFDFTEGIEPKIPRMQHDVSSPKPKNILQQDLGVG